MLFEDFFTGYWTVLWTAFGISVVLGAVVNKTNFCTMGAVSDWVNIGDTGRLRAWFLAATVAMIGVVILEYTQLISIDSSLPPYRGFFSNATEAYPFMWGRFLIGGLLFGIGMTFASGCGNKTLIRIGGGNIKSILVLVIIAYIAYNMVDPFKMMAEGTWFQNYFGWVTSLSFNMDSLADVGSIISNMSGVSEETKEASVSAVSARLVAGLVIGLVIIFFIFRSKDFRSSFDNVFAGLVIGLLVVFAWFLTSSAIDSDGEAVSIPTFVADNWEFYADDQLEIAKQAATEAGMDAESIANMTKPVAPVNVNTNFSPTSFTFISPIGQVYGYTFASVLNEKTPSFDSSLLTFGLMSVFGVILGSLLWALLTKSFRIEWFVTFKDFYMHVIGAILMGFGGVLGLGCTVGQAISGFSTMAIGAYLTFAAIIFGSAITMKIQLYKMCYEGEATFFSALITGLVDMKMLPESLRKHESM